MKWLQAGEFGFSLASLDFQRRISETNGTSVLTAHNQQSESQCIHIPLHPHRLSSLTSKQERDLLCPHPQSDYPTPLQYFNAGLSNSVYGPPAMHIDGLDSSGISVLEARRETCMVFFGATQEVLKRTGEATCNACPVMMTKPPKPFNAMYCIESTVKASESTVRSQGDSLLRFTETFRRSTDFPSTSSSQISTHSMRTASRIIIKLCSKDLESSEAPVSFVIVSQSHGFLQV